MRNPLGIVLIIAALALGYLGYKKIEGSKAGLKIGDAEISATDTGKRSMGFILLGGGAILLIAGAVIVSKGNKR